MLDIVKFRAWLRASDLNLILNESELGDQSLKVEAHAFWAFEQLVHLCSKEGIERQTESQVSTLWRTCESMANVKILMHG